MNTFNKEVATTVAELGHNERRNITLLNVDPISNETPAYAISKRTINLLLEQFKRVSFAEGKSNIIHQIQQCNTESELLFALRFAAEEIELIATIKEKAPELLPDPTQYKVYEAVAVLEDELPF